MESSLIIEVLSVAFFTMIIGLGLSYVSMGDKSHGFKHWGSVAGTFFLTGALVHLLYEWMGANRWYCKHGFACQAK
jgi:hypothetical protein